MCAKPLKPVCKEVEKPKAAVVQAAAAPKKEEKVKDNVESLGETPFVLYDFKTLLCNHPDKGGAGIDTWYKMNDWSANGWSFWHLHYDIYEGEGDKMHICNNLMGGFLSRAEHATKYCFGKHCVLGEEGSLQIMGCWFMRGQELPDGLAKEHPQFEYYKTRKLDPRNVPEDDKLIRSYFGGKEGDTISGLKCQTMRWVK
jgi:elongation factor 1-gamma